MKAKICPNVRFCFLLCLGSLMLVKFLGYKIFKSTALKSILDIIKLVVRDKKVVIFI